MVKVCFLEDQPQFILYHQVMEQKADDQVTVSTVVEAKTRFPTLNVCTFDKGFHSPVNQMALKAQLALVVLSRKGKVSAPARTTEQSPKFIKARRAHSVVESAIKGLEIHGLDRCPEHGIKPERPTLRVAVARQRRHWFEGLWANAGEPVSLKPACNLLMDNLGLFI